MCESKTVPFNKNNLLKERRKDEEQYIQRLGVTKQRFHYLMKTCNFNSQLLLFLSESGHNLNDENINKFIESSIDEES